MPLMEFTALSNKQIMKSKIIVEMDFELERSEPFLQLNLSHPEESDLVDKTLRNFINCANHSGIKVVYPNVDTFNNYPQIRLATKKHISVTETSQEFRDWLDKQDIPFSVNQGELIIEEYVNEFNLGVKWAEFKAIK